MRSVILDTNVFISGIFWKGTPFKILNAWKQRKIDLVTSLEILDEYTRVSSILEEKYKHTGIVVSPFIDLITIYAKLYKPCILTQPISADPDDDKFIACALGANCTIIVSGDKDLLSVSGHAGIEILKAAEFLRTYISI